MVTVERCRDVKRYFTNKASKIISTMTTNIRLLKLVLSQIFFVFQIFLSYAICNLKKSSNNKYYSTLGKNIKWIFSLLFKKLIQYIRIDIAKFPLYLWIRNWLKVECPYITDILWTYTRITSNFSTSFVCDSLFLVSIGIIWAREIIFRSQNPIISNLMKLKSAF